MMTQSKMKTSRIHGRVFKSTATSALTLSVLAGAVTLTGGEAKAACGDSMLSGPVQCTINDPTIGTFTDEAEAIDVTQLPSGTEVDFEATNLFYPFSQVQIDTDFNYLTSGGDYTGPAINVTYRINKKTPGLWYDGIDLHVAGIGPTKVTKKVYADAGLTNLIETLEVNGQASIFKSLPNKFTHLWIVDHFDPNGGGIDNVQNTFRNVPGPLPILGAGLALGSVRKLRNLTSRLKTYSMG
jgi:hypothetical protein